MPNFKPDLAVQSLLERFAASTAGIPELNYGKLENMLEAFAGAFTQGNRIFKLSIGDGEIFGELLLPQCAEGRERLSSCYKYELTCLSPDAYIQPESLLGQTARLDITPGSPSFLELDLSGEKNITRCGLITDFKTLSSDGGFAKYKLTIESPLSILRHRRTSRVFQDLNVPDIVETILSEHIRSNLAIASILNLKFELRNQYTPRSYCLQYRESDLAFIERLLAEEGLVYRFEFEAGITPLVKFVVFDDVFSLPQAAQGEVRFHRADATEAEDALTGWEGARRLGPATASLSSYDYKPVTTHKTSGHTRIDQGRRGIAAESTLEDFDSQGLYYGKDAADLARYAERRQEAHDFEKGCYTAQGNMRQLKAGEWFILTNHPYFGTFLEQQHREFVACEVRFTAHNNLPGNMLQYLNPQKQDLPKPYWVELEARRRGQPLTPAFAHTAHAKPTAWGVQSATVVGPAGEEVYTDEMGRIRIQFFWQRPKEHPQFGADWNERSSCWVRVAYPSAGALWGSQYIPRIGQEVLVSFAEGDIDRPIVIGVIHNGRQGNPYFSGVGSLPANRALTGIKTKEHHGSQYNELLFDDTSEEVRVKLSSEHGKTQLNQGYLIHPRKDGVGEPRGEGFELRTDLSGAIRAARGILVSAHKRQLAAGNQLDREELIALLNLNLAIADELARDSEANEAETTNTGPQKRLTEYVKNWEDGSNVSKTDLSEGKAIAALTAPEGVAIASEANILVASGASQDFVSQQDSNHTVGQKLRMRVGDALSIFARQTMKVIAALGKIRIAALSNEIEIAANKRLHLISLDEIVLDAPKITLRAQGAGVEYGGGITSKTTGPHVQHAGNHSLTGPAGVKPEGSLRATEVKYDQKVRLTWQGSGMPIKNRRYRLLLEDGRVFSGTTDADGNAEQLQSEISFSRYKVELLPPTA